MRRTVTFIALAVFLGQWSFGQSQRGLSDLAAGKNAARSGNYDDAVLALESAIDAFRGSPKAKRDLAEAYVYLGMAQLGLGREGAALESFRQALLADDRLVLKRTEFSPRVLDLYQSVGGRIEAPPQTGPKKKSPVPWIVGGLVGVGAPVAAVATKKDPVAPPDPNAKLQTDDDGDGLSEMQGDCNDNDAATKPGGRIEARFDLLMNGEVSCANPHSGTEQVTVTNHSCTAEWVVLVEAGTYLYVGSGFTASFYTTPRVFGVGVAPGAAGTLYTRQPSRLTCTGSGSSYSYRYDEVFTVTSSQGVQSRSRSYSYSSRTCPACN